MSLEVASALLDLAGIDGHGVGDRLFQAVEGIDSLEPDAVAAVAVARVCAGHHLEGVSAVRSAEIVELLATDLDVQVATSTLGTHLDEDLDGALDTILGDLERRLSALPFSARSDLRRSISKHAKHNRSRVGDLPAQLLGAFASKLAEAEAKFAPAPHEPSTGATTPAPLRASTANASAEGAPPVDAGPSDPPDEAETPTGDGAGAGENAEGVA